ncbi:MAG TPA: OFA family MFS transporter [Candidatus Acidoferrales bacterium]|nr:OFA family MFS transporter [Candidatus Acidoferrales bacterium]
MASNPASSGNRWGVLVAGIGVMLCLGTVYSWSIFTRPLLAAFNWSNEVVTWAFAVAIFCFGIGTVIGGRWQDRVGPRVVTVTGIILWGLGLLLAGLGTASLGQWWLYISYGVIGGIGGGMAYVTPVAVVTKWFPDRRGLGTGLVVMGFGLGAFFYNQIVPRIASFAQAAKASGAYAEARAAAIKAGTEFNASQYLLTADQVHAVMNVFVWSGVVFIVFGGICAWLLSNPPEGFSVPGAVAAAAASGPSYSASQALGMSQLYLLWLLLFLNVTAGILIISNAVPIFSDLTGMGAGIVAPLYGLLAVFNGLGRFFWGSVSDRIGRPMTYTVMYLIQVVIFFFLGGLHNATVVGIAFAIVLACYGGGFGVMPSFTADFFGTKNMGQIYGIILTAWGFAGLVGPLVAAWVKDHTGSFTGAMPWVAGMLIIAAVIPFFVKKPTVAPEAKAAHA